MECLGKAAGKGERKVRRMIAEVIVDIAHSEVDKIFEYRAIISSNGKRRKFL